MALSAVLAIGALVALLVGYGWLALVLLIVAVLVAVL